MTRNLAMKLEYLKPLASRDERAPACLGSPLKWLEMRMLKSWPMQRVVNKGDK